MLENIKLKMDTKKFIKELGKKGNRLQIVAADSLNQSAEVIAATYGNKLKKNSKLRNKFSLGSIRIFKAHGVSRSGEPRKLSRINAIIGIRKMKGGKKHYLAKLEEGSTTTGNPKTAGKVPIPLQGARIGGSDDKAVSAPNRLTKGETQTLTVKGTKIGVKGDAYNNSRRRWGALYRGVREKTIGGNVAKPFFMIDNDNELGIFKMIRRVISKIRDLSKTSTKVKAEPNFKKSFKAMKPQLIQKIFVANAKKEMMK